MDEVYIVLSSGGTLEFEEVSNTEGLINRLNNDKFIEIELNSGEIYIYKTDIIRQLNII